jgi:hypothetical protein
MRPFQKLSVVSLLSLAVLSFPGKGWAQGNAYHSIDGGAGLLFSSKSGIDNTMHVGAEVSAGYNLFAKMGVIGEFQYHSLGSTPGIQQYTSTPAIRENVDLIGGGVRYHLKAYGRISPYAVATGGMAHMDTNHIGLAYNVGRNGGYFAAGGGANIYVGERWGIRPEVRYQRDLIGASIGGFNEVEGTVSVFIQFGGGEAPKKK